MKYIPFSLALIWLAIACNPNRLCLACLSDKEQLLLLILKYNWVPPPPPSGNSQGAGTQLLPAKEHVLYLNPAYIDIAEYSIAVNTSYLPDTLRESYSRLLTEVIAYDGKDILPLKEVYAYLPKHIQITHDIQADVAARLYVSHIAIDAEHRKAIALISCVLDRLSGGYGLILFEKDTHGTWALKTEIELGAY